MNKGFNPLWPTEVYVGDIENKTLLDKVCQDLFLETDLNNPASSFNKEFDVLRDTTYNLKEFRDTVVWPAFENYLKHVGIDLHTFPDRRLRSWITGSKSGYMIPVHNHSGASLSAVFYLMVDENKGGELVVVDPRTNANRGYKDEFKPLFENKMFSPASGSFIMFPSFVYHHTIPYTGNLRLAMPVDLLL